MPRMPPRDDWEFPLEAMSPEDKWCRGRYDELKEEYGVKYSIARNYAPQSILEIGVRAGYSAFSFLSACPGAIYIGIDAENGSHGGAGGPWLPWAAHILRNFKAMFLQADSQLISGCSRTCNAGFDLVHIDADHSVEGATHDMATFLPLVRAGGIMLVDDYTYIEDVRTAVDRFIITHAMAFRKVASPRGNVILKREEDIDEIEGGTWK